MPAPAFDLDRAPRSAELSNCDETLRVRPGDSLWSLAASASNETHDAAIARLSKRIYSMNEQTIGDDPDIIQPGQRLSLPPDCQR